MRLKSALALSAFAIAAVTIGAAAAKAEEPTVETQSEATVNTAVPAHAKAEAAPSKETLHKTRSLKERKNHPGHASKEAVKKKTVETKAGEVKTETKEIHKDATSTDAHVKADADANVSTSGE